VLSVGAVCDNAGSTLDMLYIYTAVQFPVSVEAKLSFVKPGRRWAHSPSPSKAPGISYQGTMKTQEVSNCYMMLLSVSALYASPGSGHLEMSHQVTAVFLCDRYPQYQHQSQCAIRHCGRQRLKLPVLRGPMGQHSLFLVSFGASVGYLRVSSFFEPLLVRLSAAKG